MLDSKSLEQILGKENTFVISREGKIQVVAPYVSERLPLSESTNNAFPAHAGWYIRKMGESASFFLRTDGAERMEIHYFDSSPIARCRRTFENIPNYCGGAIGIRWNDSRQGSTHFNSQFVSHLLYFCFH